MVYETLTPKNYDMMAVHVESAAGATLTVTLDKDVELHEISWHDSGFAALDDGTASITLYPADVDQPGPFNQGLVMAVPFKLYDAGVGVVDDWIIKWQGVLKVRKGSRIIFNGTGFGNPGIAVLVFRELVLT